MLGLYGHALGLLSALVVVVVIFSVIKDFSSTSIKVDQISSTALLAGEGYTEAVLARRLSDDMTELVEQSGGSQKSKNLALPGETPTITVPGIGLSINTISSFLVKFFEGGNYRSISGEFTNNAQHLQLTLRNGDARYFRCTARLDDVDSLLRRGAFQSLKVFEPYFYAVSFHDDPERMLREATDIITTWKPQDANKAGAYNLAGNVLVGPAHRAYREAIADYRLAIKIYPRWFPPHDGVCLALLGMPAPRPPNAVTDAVSECRTALRLAGEAPPAKVYLSLGFALSAQGDRNGAIADYERAIALDPKNALAHIDLGYILKARDQKSAVAEFTTAGRLDPNNAQPHEYLREIYSGQHEEAAAQREGCLAATLDPDRYWKDFGKYCAGPLGSQRRQPAPILRHSTPASLPRSCLE